MAGVQKLTVGGDTVVLSPRAGYAEPNASLITNRTTLGGVLYTYAWYSTDSCDLPLNNISATDAALFETWRVNGSDVIYIPDFDVAPGTNITVRVTNRSNPMRMMAHQGFNTTGKYEGVLSLQKTTAN